MGRVVAGWVVVGWLVAGALAAGFGAVAAGFFWSAETPATKAATNSGSRNVFRKFFSRFETGFNANSETKFICKLLAIKSCSIVYFDFTAPT